MRRQSLVLIVSGLAVVAAGAPGLDWWQVQGQPIPARLGRIRANIAATDARLNAALADYDAVVLKAFEDVENAYRMRSALDARSTSLTAA